MYVDISLNRISTLHYLMYFCNAQKRQLGRLFTAIAPILTAETVLAIKYNISMALAKRIVAKRQSLDTCCFLIWLHQEICTETDKCGFFLAFIMFLLITRMLVNDWYLLNFFPSRFYFTLEYIYILHMPQNLWSVIIFFFRKVCKAVWRQFKVWHYKSLFWCHCHSWRCKDGPSFCCQQCCSKCQ